MQFDLKKILHFLSTVILYSVFIIMILIFLAIGAYFVDQAVGKGSDGEYRAPLFGAYVIISPSMVPNVNVYDVVVTMRKDMNKIKVDDIITFRSEDSRTAGVTITHRVVGIVDVEGGKKAFRTKGDNNNTEDSTLVNYDHIIGEVLFKVPQLGRIQEILTSSSGWLLLIVLPCVGIVLYDLFKLAKLLFKKKEVSKTTLSTVSESSVDVFPENNTSLDLGAVESHQGENVVEVHIPVEKQLSPSEQSIEVHDMETLKSIDEVSEEKMPTISSDVVEKTEVEVLDADDTQSKV